MDNDFLQEPYFTTKALADKYGVAYQTMKKWIADGRFSHPDRISVYRLTDKDALRITQSGVDWFNSQIQVIGGAK